MLVLREFVLRWREGQLRQAGEVQMQMQVFVMVARTGWNLDLDLVG